ncbi:MAG: YceI family protein [Bacteroidales bacterium]|nr:YceI family protein [Bacteroidales bacterium]
MNTATGEVVINITMTKFEFEKKLMQEHFNENYVESELYPKASFKGFITNNDNVNYSKKGVYQVNVAGDMTIHGVTNKVSSEGTLEVTASGLTAKTKFLLNPEVYEIEIPKIVREKIANNLEITADIKYKGM